uniref:Secreted protein n=1 Tax=Anopheles quadriannulatus TaxID=34691 RepID=A0A182X4I3_ANOQN
MVVTKGATGWQKLAVTVWCAAVVVCCVVASPLPAEHPKDHSESSDSSSEEKEQGYPLNSLYSPLEYGATVESDEATLIGGNSTQNTTKELYVIKAVVYEIGILADVPENETLEGDEPITHQQVDLSFFSHGGNDTHLDLGDIPVPIQTSVQGQVFTGIAPVHVGTVPTKLSDLLSALPIAGTVVNISQTNSSYVEVHKHNISDAAVLLQGQNDLSSLPFGSSVSEPLVPASVDETVVGLTNKAKTPEAENH